MNQRFVHSLLAVIVAVIAASPLRASEFEPDLAFVRSMSDVVAEVRISRVVPVHSEGEGGRSQSEVVCGYLYSVEFVQTYLGQERTDGSVAVFSTQRVTASERRARWLVFAAAWPTKATDGDAASDPLSGIEGACRPTGADFYATTAIHFFRELEEGPSSGTWVWTTESSVFETDEQIRRVRTRRDGVSVPMFFWADVRDRLRRTR